jgi:hypothetical protein
MSIENISNQSSNDTQISSSSKDSVVGKVYNFSTVRYATLKNLVNGKIRSEVTFSNDRLFIDTKPRSFNKVPVVLYDEIIGVTITVKLHLWHCILMLLSIASAIVMVMPFTLILAALFFWLGRDRKITITQKSGVSVVIYSMTKEQAEEFKNDIRKVANIQ